MHDWRKLVWERLSGLALDCDEKEEVYSELAAHLEESYETLRAAGFSEHKAIQRTLAQVADWKKLQRQIQIAREKENIVTHRVSRIWLPSLVTLVVSITLLPALEWFGLNPQFSLLVGHHDRTYGFSTYTVWLATLPLVGALGAYLSTHAGGTRSAILVSGIFPALAFFVVLLFAIPYMTFLEHGLETSARSVFRSWTSEFGHIGVVAGWVLAPGACLMIGVQTYLFAWQRLRGVSGV